MFHVNDAYDDKGTLTVKDGKMTIHISLVSKNIVNLFPGTIKDAKKKGAKLLQPTTDTITDENGNVVTDIEGKPKEVYGFDVPVPALDKEFDLALIGTKGKLNKYQLIIKSLVFHIIIQSVYVKDKRFFYSFVMVKMHKKYNIY